MTQVYCPSCGLRFSRATGAHLLSCPECDQPVESVPSGEYVLGYRLASPVVEDAPVAVAVAVALPRLPRHLS
jgi:hypothetical protein